LRWLGWEASYRWYVTVDTIPPTIPSLLSPYNGAETNDSTVYLDWNDSSDSGTGVAYYRVQVDNSSSFSSPEFDATPSSSNDTTSSLSDGLYYWHVRAKDNVGNWSSWSSSRTFRVDNLAPTTGTITIVDSDGYTNDATPTLEVNSSGADYMRFALTEGGLSSATWVAYQTGYSGFDISSGGEGSKTIWVEYKNEAGNIQTTHASDTTIYDTVAPSSSATAPTYENSTISIYWTASDAISGVASTQLWYKKAGGTWADTGLTAQTGTSGTFRYDPTEGDGTYYFASRSTDNAGNVEAALSGDGDDSTIYDITPPEPPVITTNSGNDYSTPDSSITLSGTCTEDTNGIYVNGSTDGVTYTAGETSWTYTGTLESGENSFEITAEDAAGNVSDVDSITISYVAPIGGYINDNVIPAAQISQSTDGYGIITVRFKIKDSTNDPCTIHTFQYSVDGGDNWDIPANGDDSESLSNGWKDNSDSNYSSAEDFDSAEEHTFSFNTKHQDVTGLDGEDQSDVRVRFTINDGIYDSSSPVTSESFRVDNLAPTTGTITIVDSDGYTNDATPILEVSSSGAARMRFALTEGGLSSATWVAYQTGYSGFDISSGGEGSKTIWVEYKNEAGNIQTTHASDTTIYDTTPSDPPVITTNSGNDYSTSDSEITLNGTCAADTNAIYVNGSTEGVNYTPGETSWTYTGTLESGENSFEVTVEDTAGNVSDVDSITVTVDNFRPDKPDLYLPQDTDEEVSLTPELQTDSFYDSDVDDFHTKTQWQVMREDNDLCVLDITSAHYLTSLIVPESILDEDTSYYWRVRFYDNHSLPSAWSDTYSFRTVFIGDDQDSNGIPDDQEVDSAVDLDNDGTPDMNQSDMKCVNAMVGDGQIGIKEGTNVGSIELLCSIDPNTISDTENRPDDMPLGLIGFKLEVNTAGDIATVTVYLSEPASSDAKWYKYDFINGWQDYSAHATFGSDRTSVTLVLKDGDYGDVDGAANGIIVDPSALVFAPDADGGVTCRMTMEEGCFIGTAAYGSRTAKGVIALRNFRDDVLLTNSLARSLTEFYCKVSPPLADYIGEHKTLRTAARLSLTLLVYGVKYPKTSALIFLAIVIAIILTLRARGWNRFKPTPFFVCEKRR